MTVGSYTDTARTQEIHSRLHRHVKGRLAALEKGQGVDWATAEASQTRQGIINTLTYCAGSGFWVSYARGL